jgi:hypothetical protein
LKKLLPLISTVILIVLLLIGLNAVSYIKPEDAIESEQRPNRSSYNSRETGTRALFEYLQQTGYNVTRWRKPFKPGSDKFPETLLIAGPTTVPFSDSEIKNILDWVRAGGRLIISDRDPPISLIPQTSPWRITYYTPEETDKNRTIPAIQPAPLSKGVKSIEVSAFAGRFWIEQSKENQADKQGSSESALSPFPVPYFADEHGSAVIDFVYGKGRILLLSDPYVIANNGISRADNLQLGLNLVGFKGDQIAFDEYHHGWRDERKGLIAYMRNTPLFSIAAQLLFLLTIVLWTSAYRYGRPLPMKQVDRRAKLEFVSSMAELQLRAQAYDLAIENIYKRTRRIVAQYYQIPKGTDISEFAGIVAEKSGLDRQRLESTFKECEYTIAGSPVSEKRALYLANELRTLEAKVRFGLRT